MLATYSRQILAPVLEQEPTVGKRYSDLLDAIQRANSGNLWAMWSEIADTWSSSTAETEINEETKEVLKWLMNMIDTELQWRIAEENE